MDPRIEIAGVTKEFTLRHRRSLKELAANTTTIERYVYG